MNSKNKKIKCSHRRIILSYSRWRFSFFGLSYFIILFFLLCFLFELLHLTFSKRTHVISDYLYVINACHNSIRMLLFFLLLLLIIPFAEDDDDDDDRLYQIEIRNRYAHSIFVLDLFFYYNEYYKSMKIIPNESKEKITRIVNE